MSIALEMEMYIFNISSNFVQHLPLIGPDLKMALTQKLIL